MAAAGRRGSSWFLWVLGSVSFVLVALLVWGAVDGGRSTPDAGEQRRATSPADAMAERFEAQQRREPGDPLAMGRTDAPVVLIEYEDFRCPFCTKFTGDVEPKLIERYVDTGVLRIEWRDLPVFGEQSIEMAKAGRAAARQDKFWAFHDAAYAMGSATKKASFPENRIQQVAKKAGIPDLAKFNEDRDDPAIMKAIEKDRAEAAEIGISATPSFLVNGQAILGAQPLEQFVAVIEAERAKA